jgi:NadR type nicotinamide-nucleotide adenylyltransferase
MLAAVTAAASPPPIAWYGGSFAYYDDEPAPGPTEEELDAAAERARQQRQAGFTPEQFGPPPGPREGTGVVLGRFLPVHDGHRYLIEYARAHVTRVHVFVRVRPDDPVPWPMRRAWLAELFPDVAVTAIEEEREHWPERILAEVRPDYMFGGEPGGPSFAQVIGAEFIPVDRRFAVSGTGVRRAPWDFERYLPPPVRAWYAGRVCLIGAESTGKSHLANDLAQRYDTVWVAERLRELGLEITPASLALAAHGQATGEDLLARRARRLLFCDTDVLAVRLWSERLFGTAPAWLVEAAERRSPHLYLLCAPDIPYTGDERYNTPAERRAFHATVEGELVRLGRPYVVLEGEYHERIARASEAVDDLLTRLW